MQMRCVSQRQHCVIKNSAHKGALRKTKYCMHLTIAIHQGLVVITTVMYLKCCIHILCTDFCRLNHCFLQCYVCSLKLDLLCYMQAESVDRSNVIYIMYMKSALYVTLPNHCMYWYMTVASSPYALLSVCSAVQPLLVVYSPI
jgi:hypothetical protein